MKIQKVLLIAYRRTAIGSLKGKQSRVPPEELAAHALLNAIQHAGIKNLSQIDKIVMGQCVQSYFTPNFARFAALNIAGLPANIPAHTVHQQCASGMTATYEAFQEVQTGRAELVFSVGTESMSYTHLMVPAAQRWNALNRLLVEKLPKMFKTYGPMMHFGLADSGLGATSLSGDPSALNMILTAQTVANMCGITREEADQYALISQARASAAQQSGRLALEIAPFIIPGVGVAEHDEYPRKTTIEQLRKLRDVARSGVVTAGNASGMGCGAAAVGMCSEKMAEKLGAKVLCEVVDFRFIGRNAVTMGLGPVKAFQELLRHNKLDAEQIDYTELNPAFAVQALACMKLLNLHIDDVNHNGDAISLSHPLGMTGARQTGTTAIEISLNDNIEWAIATQCVGGGMGGSGLFRKYCPSY